MLFWNTSSNAVLIFRLPLLLTDHLYFFSDSVKALEFALSAWWLSLDPYSCVSGLAHAHPHREGLYHHLPSLLITSPSDVPIIHIPELSTLRSQSCAAGTSFQDFCTLKKQAELPGEGSCCCRIRGLLTKRLTGTDRLFGGSASPQGDRGCCCRVHSFSVHHGFQSFRLCALVCPG